MRNRNPLGALVALFVLLVSYSACTDPTEVGAELLDVDRAQVGFTDTFNLQATSVRSDSVLVYSPSYLTVENYFFGRFDDPVFGTTEASFFLRPRLRRDPFTQDFADPVFVTNPTARLDSLVLILPLDTSATYGNIAQTYGVDIFEMLEPADIDVAYYSDTLLPFNPMPVSTASFVPDFDSTLVSAYEVTGLTDSLIRPHVRIRISGEYAQRYMNRDSTVFQSDSLFAEAFPGLYLRPNTTNGGLIDFDLLEDYAGLYLYYHTGIADPAVYGFSLSARISHYEHDYSNSIAGNFLNSPSAGDSLIFVQGPAGLLGKVDLTDLTDLNGQIVNDAELEMRVRRLPEDDPDDYPLPEQLLLFFINPEGEMQVVPDVFFNQTNLSFLFGGAPEEENGEIVYRMKLSVHLQDIIDGEAPATIFIGAEDFDTFPNVGPSRVVDKSARVVLAGPRGGEGAIRLKVAFTKL